MWDETLEGGDYDPHLRSRVYFEKILTHVPTHMRKFPKIVASYWTISSESTIIGWNYHF